VGIQALVVFVGLTIALIVGVLAGTSEVAGLAGWLAIGLVPLIWASVYLMERVIGRQIWQHTAPYPYPWMQVATVPEVSEPRRARHRPPGDPWARVPEGASHGTTSTAHAA
jgi:hypothetical protein